MTKPRIVSKYEHIYRNNRFLAFISLISELPRPLNILDLGGTLSYWKSVNYDLLGDFNITLFNMVPKNNLPCRFTSVVGDARCLSNFKDKEFDLVFSNATLNLVGSYENQQQMASEIRRVGKQFVVQIPNRYFPLDWRTLMPFFHLIPSKYQAFCFMHFKVGTYERVKDFSKAIELATRVRDVTKREVNCLFPNSKLIEERVLGFTKSFIVHSF